MYDRGLAARLDEILGGVLEMDVTYMFGGYGYLMNANMCVGVWNDRLVIRIGVDGYQMIADEPHVRPMDLTGRVMRGWAMIEPTASSKRNRCGAMSKWHCSSVQDCRQNRADSG